MSTPFPPNRLRESAEAEAPVEESPMRVLLLEDDEIDAENVQRTLRSGQAASRGLRFEVGRVERLADAVEKLLSGPFDVVIADLGLPDGEGLDVVQRVMSAAPEAAVVILTGRGEEELAIEAVRAGAQDYLTKDTLRPLELIRSVQYALERVAHLKAERFVAESEQEQVLAADIQRRLLSAVPPRLEGFQIAGGCEPAHHVGGDYYDFIGLAEGRLAVVVADVSGHGVGPAITMAGLRRTLRTCFGQGLDLATVLRLANRGMIEDTDCEQFASAFIAVLDPVERRFVYAGAGQGACLIRADGSHVQLDSTAILLGIEADFGEPCVSAPMELEPGDLLVIVTDGFTEAMNDEERQWTRRGFLETIEHVRHESAEGIVRQLFAALHDYCGGRRVEDDATLVVVKAVEPHG